MNLNQGKRNKQAVQVLNKVEYDSEGNPIGMMEDPSNPASANFGTPREPRRGGCYKGNGSVYVTIPGLLSTDTVEVFDGSDMPTISNGRLDIASGDKVFGVKIFRAGELWAKYNCSENSGSIAYDSSGNGNHGTIINAITTTPEENPNSIHQYQDVYSFENEEGYNLSPLIENSNFPEVMINISPGDRLRVVLSTTDSSFLILTNKHQPSSWLGVAEDPPIGTLAFNTSITATTLVDGEPFTQNSRKEFHRLVADGTPHVIEFIFSREFTEVILMDYRNAPASNARYNFTGFIHSFNHYNSDNVLIGSYFESIVVLKNYSVTLPPFKNILGNNLQYIGKVPGKAKFVNSSCFLSDGNAYLSGDVLTTDIITAHPESEVPVCTTDGRLDFPIVGGKYFDITIERGGSVIVRLPLCEPIIAPSNHIYHDISGNGNHATLINGTFANGGKQDKFHYLQRGLIKRDTGELIPILDDESGFADGSLLDDVDAIPQDSHSFLNTGTELEAYDYPALKQADKDDDFWYEDDGLGVVTPKPVQFDSLITQKGLSDKLFLDSSVSETIKNVRMYGSDLKGKQLNTENKLTNN